MSSPPAIWITPSCPSRRLLHGRSGLKAAAGGLEPVDNWVMDENERAATGVKACATALVREPLAPERAVELSRVFKALADPNRLRLLSLIASHEGGEACVCDISEFVSVNQPTISHHLKVLRNAGLVSSRRRGTWVHYWVNTDALDQVADALAASTRTPSQ